MLYFPPAKINIGLRILRKRPDAYHDLELSFFEVPALCDVLEISTDEEDRFICEGLDIPGSENDNLILKARNLISRRYGKKRPACRIHLLKKIPMGSGLGGGSSDAAYTLLGMNETLHLGFSEAELRQMAAELGSDCAFFLTHTPCLGYGKGDRLFPLQTGLQRKFRLVIAVPPLHVSTAAAFKNCRPDPDRPPLKELLDKDISSWKDRIENDFEKSLFPVYPVLGHIKQTLYEHGAVYASMSGSGSAVFGLFDREMTESELELPENCLIRQSDILIP